MRAEVAGVGFRHLPMLLKEAHLRLQMSFFFPSWHHFGLLLMLATWKSRISFLANHRITLSFLTWELVHYGSKKCIIRKEEMCSFSSTFHSGRALYESCFMLRQHFHSQRILRASPALSLLLIWETPAKVLVMDSPRGPQALKQGWVVCSLEKEDIHASNHP